MKQIEKGKEINYAFVGVIDCNVPAASGVPIAINGKWSFNSCNNLHKKSRAIP
jgi:hypothetical protein